jgi:hypothetical protein
LKEDNTRLKKELQSTEAALDKITSEKTRLYEDRLERAKKSPRFPNEHCRHYL